MPLRFLLTLSLFTLMCANAYSLDETQASQSPPASGIPRELARWRAEHYRDVRYALDISLFPGEDLLKGRLKINVTLDASAGDLVLDWRVIKGDADPRSRVSDITANGNKVEDAQFINEHIIIPRAHLTTGANTVEMSFASPISTSGSAVTRYLDREDNSEYVYSLFVPSDASTTFPCFDQPDLKARFSLNVGTLTAWNVISNTVAEIVTRNGTNSLWHFRETEPLSTYQFAFAAGPFAEFEVMRLAVDTSVLLNGSVVKVRPEPSRKSADEGPRIRVYVRKSKAERALKEIDEVVRLNRDGLKFYEGYFGHKFPFPKYDLVLVPEFAYAGMEHAGATFLREDAVLFPSDPTSADKAARAETMLHEAAHQWFGDLVTMRWFDDLWLKEGFATFMAYKAIEALMPEYNAWKLFHLRTKPLAYLTDVTKGTTPIFQEIPNLSAAKSAYGNIVYRKAPSMLRQAEFYLGPQQFQRAIQLFVKEHAYSNATWEDLVRAFEQTSGKKLDAWAAAWVKRRGMPDVRVRWTTDAGGDRIDRLYGGRINSFTVQQTDVLKEGGAWPMRLKIFLAYHPIGGGEWSINMPVTTLTVTLDGSNTPQQVTKAIGLPRPDYVFTNFEDYGYGRFLLDDASRADVLKNLGAVKDDFLRALLWDSLWDSVREAELAPADFIALAVREAPREHDDVMLGFILARTQTAFTRYLSDEQRRALAPALERALYDGMMRAETGGLRITYFRAYREAATTGEALNNLSAILSGKLQVPGMTLRSRDRFDLARALVERADAQVAKSMLDYAVRQDSSDDGRRYAYAANAAWPDPSVKKKYFEQYVNDKEIAESWIEASLGAFNTARQSELTLPYLEPALGELPTLKRTRKIFFVNGWLAAFIGGQCSERAVSSVRDFLARQPALDRDLRLKVLEASDGLERCVRIRARYAGDSDARRVAR